MPLAVLLCGCANHPVETGAAQSFEPTWESLRTHQLPAWFDDAKLGILIHWGLYSVPGWATPSGELNVVDWNLWFANNPYSSWYLNTLRIADSATRRHHEQTYGTEFDYFAFAAPFNQAIANWDPEAMAALYQKAGAKYVVLTAKSHDGFALWPTEVANPHLPADRQKAARDIPGELSKSVRARGLRLGLYYSGGLDWSFSDQPIEQREQVATSVPHNSEYARYADAQWRELIDRYQPDILWNDVAYPLRGELEPMLADYYNRFPEGVINNRWGTRLAGSEPRPADFATPEYQAMNKISEQKWEMLRALGYSLGYNREETSAHMLSAEQLIHLLIDVVSKNGNLLLSIGPEADGAIPAIQAERLRALGEWLAIHGEALFGTRPWSRAEGVTSDGLAVRFTQKGNALFVLLLGKPAGSEVTIESLPVPVNATITLAGDGEPLDHRSAGGSLSITLPSLPYRPAYALKITPIDGAAGS